MMDDILAKKNRHLFLEEKDNQNNSFIGNINDVASRKEELDTVAAHIENVDTVGDHIDNVDTVANNISDINDAVDNIATVKTFNDNVNNGTMQYLLEAFTTSLNNQGNAWEVRLTQLGESILATTSAFNYSTVVTVSSDIPVNGTLILPNSMKYKVGTHMLMVSWNGTVCYAGDQYDEVGAYGVWATSIKLNQPAKAGDKIQLRIVALTDQFSYVDITEAAINASQFVASGSNTERYLPEFLGDIVNVKNFGAIGNGINDDTTAFQSAVATGKAVFVPEGTYKLTTDIKGKFFCFDGTTSADDTKIEDFYKTARHQKMMSVAFSLVSPVQTYCSQYYPEHPYTTYWYQSACYDSKRDVFYLGQVDLSDESQAGKIQTLTDILDPSTVTASTASIAGHFNDIEYDAKNDVLYVATGQTGTVEKSIYILNPETKAVIDTWYVGFNVWGLAVKDGWLYTVNGSGNLVRYNTTTKTQDDSFSITADNPPMVNDEVFASQAMFFINDILVRSGVVVNSGTDREQKRCVFILYDIETSVSFSCGYKTGNYKELEACVVKDDTIYQMFASTWYLTFGVSKVGLFSTYGPYSKLITSSNEYSDLNKCIDDGVYHIKDAATLSALTNAPKVVHPGSGTLTVRKLGHGGWCEQTLTLDTGEEFTRINNLSDAGNFFRTWYKKGFSGQYGPSTGTVSLDDFTEPGFISLTNVSDSPSGSDGNLIVYRWDNYTITYAAYTQVWFRARTNEIWTRMGVLLNGTLTWYDWVKRFCSGQFFNGNVSPSASNTYSLGQDGYRWSNIYAYTSTIGTSDERVKDNIENPSEALMRAWGKVNFKVFQFKDAIKKKGNEARIHVGIIAQQIKSAFESEGLDTNKYGLFCYDKWDDEWDEETVVDEQEKLDEYGNVVSPMKTHVERTLKREAGDLYSLRYEECLVLECAYQRWLGKQQDAKIEALMQRISALENNQ